MDLLDSEAAGPSTRPQGWHERLFGKDAVGDGDTDGNQTGETLRQGSPPIETRKARADAFAARRKQLRLEPDNWLKSGLGFERSVAAKVIDAIMARIATIEPRQKARRPADLERFRYRIELIAANAYWANSHRLNDVVCYYRKKDKYKEFDVPNWVDGRGLSKTVGLMEQAGLLFSQAGEWSGWLGSPGVASTFAAYRSLSDIFDAAGVTERSLCLDPEWVSLLRMKDADGVPIRIDKRAPEAVDFRNRLKLINDLIAKAVIELRCSDDRFDALCGVMCDRAIKDQRKRRRPYRPEFFRTVLYRSFSEGRWDLGGRFYGGWWQDIPEDWRGFIWIDGWPTIELDYSGFSVRALYHLRGMEYVDDPYILEQFGNGASASHYSPTVKLLTQALINGDQGGRPYLVDIPQTLPKGLKKSTIIKWIRAKHSPINDGFQNGEGLKLQALDASIAEGILMEAVRNQITVLPIHDSFIATTNNIEWLHSTMIKIYKEKMGYIPIIH